jgi:regulator of RNase E activity RraA
MPTLGKHRSLNFPLFGKLLKCPLFWGFISTVQGFADNSHVKTAVEGPGLSGVWVVDGCAQPWKPLNNM